jgi:hypothetical protein
LVVTFSLERKSNQKVMRGFVAVFKGAYEIASLSSRKTRSLGAFFHACARQKPVVEICGLKKGYRGCTLC